MCVEVTLLNLNLIQIQAMRETMGVFATGVHHRVSNIHAVSFSY